MAGYKATPPEIRVWKYVKKTRYHWVWTGGTSTYGYGMFLVSNSPKRVTQVAHKYIYELLIGRVPDGLELDHTCLFPGCVNPLHLEPVTHQVNMARAWAHRPRVTHCPAGHEYNVRNSYLWINSKGIHKWACKACVRARAKALAM